MHALAQLKSEPLAVSKVIESEALRQMVQSFSREDSEWLSVAVHTEVMLQHVLEASAHLPTPNRFRTEAVCALLHTFATTLGRFEPVLRQLQADLYASIFEGVRERKGGVALHGSAPSASKTGTTPTLRPSLICAHRTCTPWQGRGSMLRASCKRRCTRSSKSSRRCAASAASCASA